jgi:signal transduction histidine kinase
LRRGKDSRTATNVAARLGRTPTTARVVGLALVVGGLYALGAELPFWFLQAPAAGVAFFPSAGVTLAAFVLSDRRYWPVLIAVVASAEIAVDLQHGQTVGMALGFALANVAEPMLGATLLRWAYRRDASPLRALALFVVTAVVIGPMLGGAIGGAVAALHGTDPPAAWVATKWWIGDALGVLVVGTPVLAWAERLRHHVDPPTSVRETAALTVVVSVATLGLVLVSNEPIVYAVLPLLIWAALRGGVTLVATAGLGMAFVINWAAVTGRAHPSFVASGSPDDTLLLVQLFIAVSLLSALTLAANVAERMQAQRAQRASEAASLEARLHAIDAAASERRSIASEVHDIVGHALNVVLLQAGGARRVLSDRPQRARELIESIEVTGRDAFKDLDAALGLVDSSPNTNGRGLSDVEELVSGITNAGVPVKLVIEGEPRQLPRLIDWSAFRIVQEALTNVLKHGGPAMAEVRLRFGVYWLTVEVCDTGHGPSPTYNALGHGLVGMRERVALYGGTLRTGPRSGGGFRVFAKIPVEQLGGSAGEGAR